LKKISTRHAATVTQIFIMLPAAFIHRNGPVIITMAGLLRQVGDLRTNNTPDTTDSIKLIDLPM
jgi:hypothetical protein